mmetsp:Transcript_10449/g.14792  ORF Transcript_10449/g.14792 Transcript_10449/m.14792 type:complete len:492 (-) Transcript_10449:92-1567(-)
MSGNSWFVSQQRQRTSRNAILAIFVVALLMSVVSGSFHGKASHQNSYRALGQNDINVIDYDGDLDSIIQLAQEIADRESAADVVTELPPDELNEEDSTTLSCPGQETFSDMQQIQYTYSMTLYPESDLDDVRNQFVVKLNEYLAMQLLDCENPSRKLRKRKLEGGIAVAVNTQRGTSSSKTCDDEDDSLCTAWDGASWLLLANNVNFDEARYFALTDVRKFVEDIASNRVAGLRSASYLAPEFARPNAVSNEAESQTDNSGISASVISSSTGIVIFSCAAAAFVLAFGVFFYVRRNKNIDSDFSAFTRDKEVASDIQIAPTQTADEDSENGDESMGGEGSQEDGSHDPRSPFSKMLPAAYQLGDSMSMSVILENDNESLASSNVTAASANVSSTISDGFVTDGFVTDMDSSVDETLDASNMVGDTPVLGARRRNGEEFEMDSAEESDYSENEGPTPVKFEYHNTRSILGGMSDGEEQTPVKEHLDNTTLLL